MNLRRCKFRSCLEKPVFRLGFKESLQKKNSKEYEPTMKLMNKRNNKLIFRSNRGNRNQIALVKMLKIIQIFEYQYQTKYVRKEKERTSITHYIQMIQFSIYETQEKV